MGARQELNKHRVVGGLGLAALLGLVTGSWTVFVVMGAVLIGTAIFAGEIRGRGDVRPRNGRHGR